MCRCIALLDTALVEGDVLSIGKVAHSISGLCANIGAVAVADTARALESLASTGNLAAAPMLHAQLVRRWRQANHALDAKTGRSGPV
jgi:HPt (histidine-containing phosphotransfer) domain-containing protein